MRALLVLAVLASCDHGGDPDLTVGSAGSGAKHQGSAGGFSASLAADLAKQTDGSAGSAAGVTTIDAGAAVATGSDTKPAISVVPVKPSDTGPVAPAGSGSGSGVTTAPRTHGHVQVSPELAAIKLSLLPNWVRDMDEGATFSLAVHVPNKDDIVDFTFHYGYDEPKVPDDHDAYMKYLADNKILGGGKPGGIVDLNRQRGAAWYLEGVDGRGSPAFRYLVLYGGKHLICYGSLYKDSPLGDTRDEVIQQAKKICESLTL